MMKRRSFLAGAGAALVQPRHLHAERVDSTEIDLTNVVVVMPKTASAREKKAAQVLIEEIEKRSQLEWKAVDCSRQISSNYLSRNADFGQQSELQSSFGHQCSWEIATRKLRYADG